jgi:hypothetical protein
MPLWNTPFNYEIAVMVSELVKELDSIVNCLRVIRFATLAVLLSLVGTARVGAQTRAEDSTDGKESLQPFLEDARKYSIQLSNGTKLQLHEKSLFNWTNPVRQQERGAIYVWLHEGRPQVIGSLFTYQLNDKVHEKHEMHSLASGPLQATFDGTLAWTPKEPGVIWHEFEKSPAPASTRIARQLQMRQLSRRFRAELTDLESQKNELRLAPRPLYEYSASADGVLDGLIFSYVVATDPEVLLLIESYDQERNGARQSGFRYAFARFHYWHVAAFEGDRKIWEAPLDRSHERNAIGNPANIGKIYNSFHPRPDG